MGSSKPLWRRGVEAIDHAAAPVLEGATRSNAFAFGYALLEHSRRAVCRRTERISQCVLHGLNLPTASDMNRLFTQIAAVEHRVRALGHEIEDRPATGMEVPGAVDGIRPAHEDRA